MTNPGAQQSPHYGPSPGSSNWDGSWAPARGTQSNTAPEHTFQPTSPAPVYDSVYFPPSQHQSRAVDTEWTETTETPEPPIASKVFSALMVLTSAMFALLSCGLLVAIGLRLSSSDNTAFQLGDSEIPAGAMIALPLLYLILAGVVEMLRRSVLRGHIFAKIACTIGAFLAVMLGITQIIGPDAQTLTDHFGTVARVNYAALGVLQIAIAIAIGITAWRTT